LSKCFNGVREETATRFWPSKKVDRTKIQFKGNNLRDNQNKMVPAGSGMYQEERTGLVRNQKQKTYEHRRDSVLLSVYMCWRRICGLAGGLSKL